MGHQSEPALETNPSTHSQTRSVARDATPSIIATPDWASFQTVLIGFPARPDTWRNDGMPAQRALLTFVSQLLQNTLESITIVSSPDLSPQSEKLLKCFQHCHSERLSVIYLPMDDCWLRDTGPIFTSAPNVRGRNTGTCFKFNAWGGGHGGCYLDYDNDALLNTRLCNIFGLPTKVVDTVLEGGSVSSDGRGTILATEECLLHPNRNPSLTKMGVEAKLRRFLGAKKVIWLPYGAAYDDDTNGHVDNIAVFARPGHVILAYGGCEEQRTRSKEAAQVLERQCDAEGNRIVVHRIPTPVLHRTNEEANGVRRVSGVKHRSVGRICASYVNFFICGNSIFVPSFGVAEDLKAEKVLSDIFKGKKIVMVDAREFVLAGGGLHCLTLGIPREDQFW